MNFVIKSFLGDKEGAWVQVDHELAFRNGNTQANQENSKITQAKKMNTANYVRREKTRQRKLHKRCQG